MTIVPGAMDDDVKDWFTGDTSSDLAEMDRQRAAEAAEQAAEMLAAAQLNSAVPISLPSLSHDGPRTAPQLGSRQDRRPDEQPPQQGGYQQGPPPGYQQGPPPGYQQGPPPGYQQPPPYRPSGSGQG